MKVEQRSFQRHGAQQEEGTHQHQRKNVGAHAHAQTHAPSVRLRGASQSEIKAKRREIAVRGPGRRPRAHSAGALSLQILEEISARRVQKSVRARNTASLPHNGVVGVAERRTVPPVPTSARGPCRDVPPPLPSPPPPADPFPADARKPPPPHAPYGPTPHMGKKNPSECPKGCCDAEQTICVSSTPGPCAHCELQFWQNLSPLHASPN